jgi:hypothetical protein
MVGGVEAQFRYLSISHNRTPRRIHIPDVRLFRQPFKANLAGFHRPRSPAQTTRNCAFCLSYCTSRISPGFTGERPFCRTAPRLLILRTLASCMNGRLEPSTPQMRTGKAASTRDSRLRSMSVPPPMPRRSRAYAISRAVQTNTGSPPIPIPKSPRKEKAGDCASLGISPTETRKQG